ncbi:uncharacterized protein SAPINGB_P000666 [Magnusiomyces paraingens]|uniref:t-SNARE coiled-coil homology domain-containing protein n=1 Tax=Magnusiomyces paraingens TaxID=2606893 RepID=A0A5E8B2Q4_9ASCO|nr:uncharacterized protein SAPINGB_P000666 [Saprochaete ingens]VVT45186.1 unnamed protein product [Saprochaete ingens]
MANLMDNDLISKYESEFGLTSTEITQKLDALTTEVDKDQRKKLLSSVERAIEEAYEILDQLAVEIQNIPSAARGPYNGRLRDYRASLDKAKRDVKRAGEESARVELFGSRALNSGIPGASSDDIALDQRQQLLQGTASLERSSQRLRDSQRLANETEQIGANILSDLRGQREQISNARNTLMEADGHVDKSIRTLRSMARRMATNRIITVAIIVVLVLLILLVIASKFW